MIPNSRTPVFSVNELSEWGVSLAIYPSISAIAAMNAIRSSLDELKETGKDTAQGHKTSPQDFFDLVGMKREVDFDNAVGGDECTALAEL